jgi:hypothetical protein
VKVPRDQVVGFALYTHDQGVLKLSAQLYPLKADEAREVRLELKRDGAWREVAKAPVVYPGWNALFRIEKWDATKDVPYRVRHGAAAVFEGLIRKDPVGKDVIVVASLSGPALLRRRPELRPRRAHRRLAALGQTVSRDHQGPPRRHAARRPRHRPGQRLGRGRHRRRRDRR